MRIEIGDPEYPAYGIYLFGRLIRGVLLADDDQDMLRIAVYDAQGRTVLAAQGEPLAVLVRGPVEIRRATIEVPAEASGAARPVANPAAPPNIHPGSSGRSVRGQRANSLPGRRRKIPPLSAEGNCAP